MKHVSFADKRRGAVAHTDHSRSDGGRAFLPDPNEHPWQSPSTTPDALAEALAEEFIASATSGEEVASDERDEVQLEEVGGPFSITSAQEEYGATVNEENPPEGERNALPSVGSYSQTKKSMKRSLT